MNWIGWTFAGLTLVLTITAIVLNHIAGQYRKWWLTEKDTRLAVERALHQTSEMNYNQGQTIKGLRTYMEVKEALLFDSIERLVTNLRFWMPDETKVERDNEPAEWYQSVNAIFEAEKRVREIKESR